MHNKNEKKKTKQQQHISIEMKSKDSKWEDAIFYLCVFFSLSLSPSVSLSLFVSLLCMYQGDLVQLKEMPTGASNELKSKAMDHLVMAHGLRHENINPLIGK